jgi:hypothetical protein
MQREGPATRKKGRKEPARDGNGNGNGDIEAPEL